MTCHLSSVQVVFAAPSQATDGYCVIQAQQDESQTQLANWSVPLPFLCHLKSTWFKFWSGKDSIFPIDFSHLFKSPLARWFAVIAARSNNFLQRAAQPRPSGCHEPTRVCRTCSNYINSHQTIKGSFVEKLRVAAMVFNSMSLEVLYG